MIVDNDRRLAVEISDHFPACTTRRDDSNMPLRLIRLGMPHCDSALYRAIALQHRAAECNGLGAN